MIDEKQGGESKAKFGDGLIKELSVQMTKDFGGGFDERNLRYFRSFYLGFPIWNAVRSDLSWTHYRRILRVENKDARNFYINEAIEGRWSSRQLEREINSFSYQRYLSIKEILWII